MSYLIKHNTYKMVDSQPFDIPLPLSFELWLENEPLIKYEIDEFKNVSYRVLTYFTEKILTNTSRALLIDDIYFLLSSRCVQNNNPYINAILTSYGLNEYNPYKIILITKGILPSDSYWIKFSHEEIDYQTAKDIFSSYSI